MKTEIITIGDELLIGQVVNTNSSWIAERLNLSGIEVCRITTIADDKDEIFNLLDASAKRSDVVITTGGLGPTNDDITKQTICEYFNTELILNEKALKHIEELFSIRGFRLTEINRKQAEIPAKCTPIENIHGTSPGIWFEEKGKIFVFVPGVPFEMKQMLEDTIIPKLKNMFIDETIVHETVLTQGVGESFLSEKIKEWENKLPENIKLAYLPSPGLVRIRLTAKGKSKNELIKIIDFQISELCKIIPEYVFGYDDDTLEKIIGKILLKNGATLSTAESCSGGYIAHKITSVPGSSQYYKGSVVSYSNEIKEKFLEVQKESLIEHGAVSEVVVKEMAKAIQKKFDTDYAISTSGIAGPGGGTAEKVVGTTWIAVASPNKVIVKKYLFGENRERNIVKTGLTALNMLRKLMVEEEKTFL